MSKKKSVGQANIDGGIDPITDEQGNPITQEKDQVTGEENKAAKTRERRKPLSVDEFRKLARNLPTLLLRKELVALLKDDLQQDIDEVKSTLQTKREQAEQDLKDLEENYSA